MIDKIVITAKLHNFSEVERFAARNRLVRCTEGDRVHWETGDVANLTGVQMSTDGCTVTVKCSVQKQYSRSTAGRLDNSGPFTMSQARATLRRLMTRWGLPVAGAVVTGFEVGANLPIGTDPAATIALMIRVGGTENRVRELFEDATFDPGRQATSRKSKLVRKVFKVYDKTHETADRSRRPCAAGTLRIETVYRRQTVPLDAFLDEAFTDRLVDAFRRDWEATVFRRRVVGRPGVKASLVAKARDLLELGPEACVAKARAEMEQGLVSAKQFRTVREFVRDWPQLESRFILIPDDREMTFRMCLADVEKC